MAEKRFYSEELLAAWEYLDSFIQKNRRSVGMSDTHRPFIEGLRSCRDSIENADIALDNHQSRPS